MSKLPMLTTGGGFWAGFIGPNWIGLIGAGLTRTYQAAWLLATSRPRRCHPQNTGMASV